jgi:hypothetical protein
MLHNLNKQGSMDKTSQILIVQRCSGRCSGSGQLVEQAFLLSKDCIRKNMSDIVLQGKNIPTQ